MAAKETKNSKVSDVNTGGEAQNHQITIDGQVYEWEKLSDVVKAKITNLREVDREIRRLRVQMGIAQIAHVALASSLKEDIQN